MTKSPARCLILACGNSLRGDDGVGLWLAEWAEERFRIESDVRVVFRQQWTPELAEETACAESVLFMDCSAASPPGMVTLVQVSPALNKDGLATHFLGPAELLGLGHEFYNSLPRTALLLTVGAGSTELVETFSDVVQAALPGACSLLEETVLNFLFLSKLA